MSDLKPKINPKLQGLGLFCYFCGDPPYCFPEDMVVRCYACGGRSTPEEIIYPSQHYDLQGISDRIEKITQDRKWKKDWSSGGCYIHLEASEFIEALRGKGKDGGDPASEAADVIIALLAVTAHYDISVSSIVTELEKTLTALEEGTKGKWGTD